MKILSIVGTRPQLIKSFALAKFFSKKKIDHKLLDTRQHYDNELSKIFIKSIKKNKIKYDQIKNLKKNFSNKLVKKQLSLYLKKEKPDLVIVYGDTNSTLIGAQIAYLFNIEIMHIEAGLRSGNKKMLEEINRIKTDHLSKYLIVPTKTAEKNLIKEKIDTKKIFKFGDILLDISINNIKQNIKKNIKKNYGVITLHRREILFNKKIIKIFFRALENVKLKFIFPIHPHTKKILKKYNLKIPKNIQIVKPLDYNQFRSLLLESKIILTDSGGVQREAYFYKKNFLVIRNETEWPEAINSLDSSIVTFNKIKNLKKIILENMNIYANCNYQNFGNGKALSRIYLLIKKIEKKHTNFIRRLAN